MFQTLIEAAADYYVVTFIGLCIMLGSGIKALTTIITTNSRERSRREIAAYIAEGSMTPEQGERLMKADVASLANRAV
jgi:ABC-type tungstate transport system substrate-binding protein